MAKTKIIILRIVVFLLVFVGTAFVINYFMSENPPLLYDSEANIRVWLDSNRNGVRENNEPFLSNICVWAGYASQFQYLGGWQKICSNQYFLSDSSGAWSHFFLVEVVRIFTMLSIRLKIIFLQHQRLQMGVQWSLAYLKKDLWLK